MACAATLAAVSLVRGSDLVARIDAWIGGLALVAFVAALVLGWARLVPPSLALLVAAYVVHLRVDDVSLDSSAPVVAAGLLVTAELAYWSLEERGRVRAQPGEGLRHVAVVAGLGLVSLLGAAALLALVDLVHVRGLAVDLVGALAAAAALFVVVARVRHSY